MECKKVIYSCEHLEALQYIPIDKNFDLPEFQKVCADCDFRGPNLWMCLHKDCLKIGCSTTVNDHNTLHNAEEPSHVIHMNLMTHRLWCYKCQTEVFMVYETPSIKYNDLEDMDAEDQMNTQSRDSGVGSYSTLQSNNSDNIATYKFDRKSDEVQRGYVTRMSIGDSTSESSDGECGDRDPSPQAATCSVAIDPISGVPTLNTHSPTTSLRNSPSSGLVGLQNIGNTCYMNAALQALSNTTPLTRFFIECPAAVHILSEDRKPGLSRQYGTLMRDIWVRKNGGYVTPSGILYGIRNVHAMFRGYQQHDTQEFLRNFMDQLHEELKQISPPECSAHDVDDASLALPSGAQTPSPTAAIGGATTNAQMLPGSGAGVATPYDSSEGEYETCDSGVSERSSLSDDAEVRGSGAAKGGVANGKIARRLSTGTSPNRRMRTRKYTAGNIIDTQPTNSPSGMTACSTSSHTKAPIKCRSIISDIFDGKLLSSVQCLTCDRISSRVETFQDLSLPIPSRDHLLVLHGRSNSLTPCSSPSVGAASAPGGASSGEGGTCSDTMLLPAPADGWLAWFISWLRSWFYGPTVTLHDCLAAFFSTDELKGDNMYSCERCNKLRNGLKYSKVLQLPEVLCIHLKRFRHELMYSSKISAAVSFPLRGLDMRPYLHTECVSQVTGYELFSVICHHGTAGGGHYTCYSLNNHQWYEFDDQCVTRVHPDTVQNCEAYVLFYRKVTTAQTQGVKTKAYEICAKVQLQTEGAYISKQWLSRFNTCTEPGPINNADFLCRHGVISPKRASSIDQLAVNLPLQVYEYLYKKFGGCVPILNLQICGICQAIEIRIEEEYRTLRALNVSFLTRIHPPKRLLSCTWYGQWKAFVEERIPDPPGPIDNTKSNVAHGGEETYLDISEEMWAFFHDIYGGGPELVIQQAPPLVVESSEGETMSIQSEGKVSENEEPEVEKFSKGEPMETEESAASLPPEIVEASTSGAQNSSEASVTSNTDDENLEVTLTDDCNITKVVKMKKGKMARVQRRRARRRAL